MPQFFEEIKQLPGKNRTNVVVLLIAKLSHHQSQSHQDMLLIKSLVQDLKILFHNHEQQFAVLSFILKHHMQTHSGITEILRGFLEEVLTCLEMPDFQNLFLKQTPDKKDLHCQIGRFHESSIAVTLLQNPGPKIWNSVNKISERMISFINEHRENKLFAGFLMDLGPDPLAPEKPNLDLSFSRFSHTPTLQEVITTLEEKQDLPKIMLIHFMLIRNVFSSFQIDKKTQERIKESRYQGGLQHYINENPQANIGDFFWNYSNYPPYHDRGRDQFTPYLSNTLGICIDPSDRAKFPQSTNSWYPDCLGQKADIHSSYTQLLVQRDIPYVAGPSGMVSLFMAAMLFFGQFHKPEEDNYYILAIMAFITGGGLHSIHEVLTIPHVRLGLIKSYQADGVKAGNYHDFFTLFHNDPVVMKNLYHAWNETIQWLLTHYPKLSSINTWESPDLITNEQESEETASSKATLFQCIIF